MKQTFYLFSLLIVALICSSCGGNRKASDENFNKSQERISTNRLMKAINGEEIDSIELSLSENPNAPKRHLKEFTYMDKDMHLYCVDGDSAFTGNAWSADEKSMKITFIKGEMKSLEIYYPVENISLKTIFNKGEQSKIMCKNGIKVAEREIPYLIQKLEESGVAHEFETKVQKIMTEEVDAKTRFTKQN